MFIGQLRVSGVEFILVRAWARNLGRTVAEGVQFLSNLVQPGCDRPFFPQFRPRQTRQLKSLFGTHATPRGVFAATQEHRDGRRNGDHQDQHGWMQHVRGPAENDDCHQQDDARKRGCPFGVFDLRRIQPRLQGVGRIFAPRLLVFRFRVGLLAGADQSIQLVFQRAFAFDERA